MAAIRDDRWNLGSALLILLAGFACCAAPECARACPICGVPTVTLPERLALADVALLVEWVSVRGARDKTPESTTYEIVQVPRDALGKYQPGERVTAEHFVQGKAGNLYLLLGKKDEKVGVKWEPAPIVVSETSYQYIIQAPSPETAAGQRLPYFIKFLEFSDSVIANDAFAQFVNAPTKDIAAVASKLPREKIRHWLADSGTPVNRTAGYGVMLGLSGNAEDGTFLERRIVNGDPDQQIGIEGLIFGYLMLTGEEGLAKIEKTRLSNPRADGNDIYTALLATRYFWSYGNGKISHARLQASLRLLLDRPAYAESAIETLARWKDWSLHERLMKLYGQTDNVEKSTKKSIIKYMIASTMDLPAGSAEPPAHVVAGRKCLEQLRQRDPELVAETEKFFPN
jgi:hypothetical protein